MGYFINDTIAKISKKPQQVSLSGVPNYIEFENLEPENGTPIRFTIGINSEYITLGEKEESRKVLTITNTQAKEEYIFYATDKKKYVDDRTFYVNCEQHIITENLKTCLLKNSFISNNFFLKTSFYTEDSHEFEVYGRIIDFLSMGVGEKYNISIKLEQDLDFFEIDNSFYDSEVGEYIFTSTSKDSIAREDGINTSIDLDIYTNTKIPLGGNPTDSPFDIQGNYLTSIRKTYSYQPLWFNLNSTFGNNANYSSQFLHTDEWNDPGTVKNFHFIAYRNDGINREPFYVSDIFYTIKGYGRNLDNHDLKDYILDYSKNNLIKPLTNQPPLTHVRGQKHFFNFIASKSYKNTDSVFLIYRLYTQSGKYIDSFIADELTYGNCKTLNTVKLKIDEAIGKHKNIGKVKVYLTKGSSPTSKDDLQVSEELTFHILPDCLYRVKDFAFLNPLGGWSSYGFIDNTEVNLSSSANTIFKTQTPYSTISSEIEAVHTKEVKEQFTVQSMPVSVEVAKWLQEMSTSEAVYELSTKRYIIVDDMKIKYNTNDELVRVEMKYRYSDSYNGLIQ